MTGDYMLLLILCIPFAGALVTLLLRGGEKGEGCLLYTSRCV